MLAVVQSRSVSPVFVGRAEELGVLDEALARAGAGEPQALVIAGEAGVGKTRLVEEFATVAEGRGAVVALGGCVEIGADGLPFAPFSTALRALRRALPDRLAAAAAGQETELARLLPELGEAGTGGHDDEGTARLFELTARLLERVTADRTVILALEDLHWADASTRHLLSYLLRTLRTGRLVVLATYRSDDIHRRHPLRPLLAELDRLRTVRRIDLARLTREEVGRQIAGILAAEPDPAQVDAIFERSDGNAFFVEELAVAAADGCRTGLTDSLRDLLLVRVEALPGDAQKVVRIIAEGGSTVEYRLLAAVAGLTEDDLIEALRAAVGANILLPTPADDGYRFRHSLVREAVADDLLPGERSRLNRRYAEALQADPTLVPADERVMRLASYWYHAHDPARALPAVLDASLIARSRHAYSEQLRLLERAMELWDSTPEAVRATLRPVDYAEAYPPPPPAPHPRTADGRDPAATPLRYLDLMAEAAVAGRRCGERERALKITNRALHLLTDGDDPLRAAWFWVQRSRLVFAVGRGSGRQELATAQELVRGLPPSGVHAEILTHVANWSMVHDPGPDAYAAAERAVEYARMVGARQTELHAHQILGILMVEAGHVETGLAELHRVKERALAEDISSVTLNVYVNLPSELEAVGRSLEALPILEEGIVFAARHGLPDAEALVRINHTESLLALGRWDEAERTCAAAGRIGQGSATRGAHATRRAELALDRGDLAEATRLLDAARGFFAAHEPAPQYDLPLTRIAVAVAAAENRLPEARSHLTRVLDRGFPPGTHRYAWPLLVTAAAVEGDARALPAADDEGRAALLGRIRTTAKRLATAVPVWHAHALWLRAELLRAEGHGAPAEWSDAVTAFEALERPYDLARTRYRLAEALLTIGGDDERDRAAELLRLAHAVAAHLGARPLTDAVALLAQRARLTLLPAPRRRPAPADPAEALGLTSRERDVLRLVSAGRTNRQIAAELFISPKTVSVHVSNILGKLGVSGRGEAAAVAHRLEMFPTEPGIERLSDNDGAY
ncbi:LuxR family transcriptional regulator [Streptomyces sp. A012304]|uniref:helix-turn-helix transcriptional regulator n=1 Tax=Streptomyces sp. A012304 TaxID=375446 RepID=UPI0028026B57|nr:LuxR family transcriptional regulator [Streptomyces sp. A012304]GKQ41581.1 helix-turn-helix transcriptional regulator [Streptomyces sp. A012304]